MYNNAWLSPSAAWLITQCPAAASPSSGSVPAAAGAAADAGSLAHEAVRRWIQQGLSRSDPAGVGLMGAFDKAADAAGVRAASIERGVLTRARLRRAAPALAAALGKAPDEAVECEVTMEDSVIRLRGRADVVIAHGDTAVLDLKTTIHEEAVASVQVRQQLLLYAHLFQVRYGELPRRLEIVSLARGRIAVPFTADDIAGALRGLANARRDAGGPATPSLTACRFCRRRLECGAHWGLSPEDRPDTVTGRILKLRAAANGSVGLMIEPDVWVTQLRPGQVPHGARPGALVRLIFLRGPASPGLEWRATARTWGVSLD
ncbi:PD-(D/E)XK nuclease superfamily protein [Humibacillus xanthopallidus]|uniref:PD-(D/E)XK nuclease superfamily protein n=1 Tax=Humibacillus xanthopallidus TaxID=412689 RepID=A0A543PR28_9MICO|nr:PD-(D/E)XK nuclease family protein [Humibacillus xanthopallidus]TQN46525.1 PD-(D/E)XK nuclease superfamily protein [Humibacillus xanthopallidus]